MRDKVPVGLNLRFTTVSSPTVLHSLLIEALNSSREQETMELVLIGGCSRSGKSYLAGQLKKLLEESGFNVIIAKLDAWLVSKGKRKPGSNVLQRYETERIVSSITDLINGAPVYPPVYDVVTRERAREEQDSPLQITNGIVILEGVVALAIPELLGRASFRIFVDVPDTLRRERLADFYLNLKNLPKEEFLTMMDERENEEVPFIKSSRWNADVVYAQAQDFHSQKKRVD